VGLTDIGESVYFRWMFFWGLLLFSLAGHSASANGLGPSCTGNDLGKLCLGLKYVVYKDSSGNPVANEQEAIANLARMNELHSACGISFQIDEFDEIDPRQVGLPFHISELSDLDQIRSRFGDSDRLLIVTTGSWGRGGSLGETSANAWTAMPGSA